MKPLNLLGKNKQFLDKGICALPDNMLIWNTYYSMFNNESHNDNISIARFIQHISQITNYYYDGDLFFGPGTESHSRLIKIMFPEGILIRQLRQFVQQKSIGTGKTYNKSLSKKK